MDPIAVKVIDPSDQHWAQLLETHRPVRQLLPPLARQLELPEQLKYEMLREASGWTLADGQTLADAGVAAGEVLRLRPVRGPFLDAFLDALYEEAASFAAEKVWDEAQARLEMLHRVNPQYPDPKGLWRKVATQPTSPSGPGSKAPPPSVRPPPAGRSSGPAPAPGPVPVGGTGGGWTTRPMGCFVVIAGVFVLLWFLGGPLGLDLPPWFPVRGSSSPGTTTTSPSAPERPGEPVLGTGDVQVTLRWDNAADLDLHVVDPTGQEVSFLNRSVASGGQLDVDAHASCNDRPPVENVFWPSGGAPSGRYVARVKYYGACAGSGPASYELTVRVDGNVVDTRTGTLAAGEEQTVAEFTR